MACVKRAERSRSETLSCEEEGVMGGLLEASTP
jgi:hypothetical protein